MKWKLFTLFFVLFSYMFRIVIKLNHPTFHSFCVFTKKNIILNHHVEFEGKKSMFQIENFRHNM